MNYYTFEAECAHLWLIRTGFSEVSAAAFVLRPDGWRRHRRRGPIAAEPRQRAARASRASS